MNLEARQPDAPKLHPMVVLQPGEMLVADIKRHPIGILGMYVSGFLAILLSFAFVFFILPNIADQFNGMPINTIAYAALGLIVIITVLVLLISSIVYWENRWIVTTDSITQITQNSLFGRQVSQLSMNNLEDVTVEQRGILPSLFNYGTLKVETAGEKSKFFFIYCPSPNDCARRILEIHEDFLRRNDNSPRAVSSPNQTYDSGI